MVVDGGDVEGPEGVLPLGSQRDDRYCGDTFGGRRVGMSPGGGDTGSHKIALRTGLHLEMEVDHRITGDIPPHL